MISIILIAFLHRAADCRYLQTIQMWCIWMPDGYIYIKERRYLNQFMPSHKLLSPKSFLPFMRELQEITVQPGTINAIASHSH